MSIQHRYRVESVAMDADEEMASLNHEARTALCIVLMTTEAMQFEIFGPLNAAQAEALTKLYENAVYLQTLLDGIWQRVYGGCAEELVG